jgi:hypothetical protein
VYNDFELEEYNLDILTIWWVMPLIAIIKNISLLKSCQAVCPVFKHFTQIKAADPDLNDQI